MKDWASLLGRLRCGLHSLLTQMLPSASVRCTVNPAARYMPRGPKWFSAGPFALGRGFASTESRPCASRYWHAALSKAVATPRPRTLGATRKHRIVPTRSGWAIGSASSAWSSVRGAALHQPTTWPSRYARRPCIRPCVMRWLAHSRFSTAVRLAQ